VSRALRRSGWGAAALTLVSSAAPALHAEPAPWLAWSAPAECQNTSEVERRLVSLLGRPVDFATLPPTRVKMGWSPERGWSVRVTVELASGARDRALDTPSCADGFDVIALSLALILDPSLDPGALEAASAPSGEEPAAADAGGTESVLVAELDGASPTPTSTDAPLGSEAGRTLPRANTGVPPARLVVGGGPLTDLEVFPVPQFGGGLQVGLALTRFRVELEGDLLASESTRFEGAQYPVSFYSLFGALRGCYTVPLSSRLGWVACAGGQLGTLGTRERGGESRAADGLWLAAEASTGPEFLATGWLRAFARVRGVIPLIRHEFLLSEGSVVHELPWFSPQLQVGISADVTDFSSSEH
jgi:hypothetical protein